MSDEPFFLANNKALLQATPEDDLLHPQANIGVEGDTLTETQYFGFNVPEENIHGLAYMWHHPNLKVVTGGIMCWRGVKRMGIAAELFDFRAFMSDAALADDLHAFRLDNGYGVRIVEPNRRFHMTYADAARGNAVDLHYDAVTPVAMFGDGKHFEQGMKVRGTLKLRGKDYRVDCYNVRDRSWGKLRPENIMPVPPVSWTTGSFGDDLIFNCNMMDYAGSNPQLTPPFEISEERALNGGWLWRDGKLLVVTAARKRIRRHPESFVPIEITLDLTTEDGATHHVEGRMIASCPWATWPNMMANISLIEWRLDGRIGHGDAQDVLWADFVNAAHAAAAEAPIPA